MKFFELQIEFFLPVWRRFAVIVVCVLWAIVEFSKDTPVWGYIFLGIAAFSFYQFFMCEWPTTDTTSQSDSEDSD